MISIKDRIGFGRNSCLIQIILEEFIPQYLEEEILFMNEIKKYDFSKNEINYDKYEKYLNLEQLKKKYSNSRTTFFF